MKQTQNNPAYAVDDFEDLTRFANESFDTGEIDLFAFAGSEEQSPLTRLKSIILSLDWEITDETLQELAEEIRHLVEEWKGDKVAQVYLQGLSKIGTYIQERGAYAHHNAIKLLLTFFYDFEKIVASENLSQDDAARILKGDVRKFRILQYQIAQHEAAAADAEGRGSEWSEGYGLPKGENVATRQLQIAVLAIDWEVTKETIGALREALAKLKQNVQDNRSAMILIQGLSVLGDYIAEEKADAHPEAFTLLHSFSNALEQVAYPKQNELSQQTIQELLQDRVARLQELKMIIAGHIPEIEEDEPEGQAEEQVALAEKQKPLEEKVAAISDEELPSGLEIRSTEEKERTLTTEEKEKTLEDLESEIDSFFDMDGKTSAVASMDDDDDDDDEPPSTGEVIPALAGEEVPETPGDSGKASGAGQLLAGLTSGIDDFFESQKDDDGSLDELFAVAPDDASRPLFGADAQIPAMESKDSRYPDEVLPPDAIHPVDDELADDFIESSLSSKRGLTPALSGFADAPDDVEKEAEHVDQGMQNDLTEQLDSLFGSTTDSDDETLTLGMEEDLELELKLDAKEEQAQGTEKDLALDEMEESLTMEMEKKDAPAFPGVLNVSPSDDEDPDLMALNTQLDSFFSLEDEKDSAPPMPEAALFNVEKEEVGLFIEPSEEKKEEEDLEDDLSERLDVLFDDEAQELISAEEQEIAAAAEVKAVEEELEAVGAKDKDSVKEELAEFTLETAGAKDKDSVKEELAEFTLETADAEDEGSVKKELAEFTLETAGAEDEGSVKEELAEFTLETAGAEDEGSVKEELAEFALEAASAEDEGSVKEELAEFTLEAAGTKDDGKAVEEKQPETVLKTAGMGDKGTEAEQDIAFFDLDGDGADAQRDKAIVAEKIELSTEEERQVQLDALGALLPGLVQAPTPEKTDALARAFQGLRAQELSSDQQALTRLLGATVAMMTRFSTKDQKSTDRLVNELYSALRNKDAGADALPKAVDRFASWVEESCAFTPAIPAMQVDGAVSAPEDTKQGSDEVHQELSVLRNFIKTEFDKLRHELQHHNR